MKRIKKMVPLSRVAESMARSRGQNVETQLGLTLRVRQALGPSISRYVEKVSFKYGVLELYVPDPVWRRQLENDQRNLHRHLAESLPQIRELVFLPKSGDTRR